MTAYKELLVEYPIRVLEHWEAETNISELKSFLIAWHECLREHTDQLAEALGDVSFSPAA